MIEIYERVQVTEDGRTEGRKPYWSRMYWALSYNTTERMNKSGYFMNKLNN